MGNGTNFTCGACGKKASFSSGWLVYKKPSGVGDVGGEDVVIGHPGEESQMRALGTSLAEAGAQQRLYGTTEWGCRSCGGVFEHTRRLVRTGVLSGWIWFALGLAGFVPILGALPVVMWFFPEKLDSLRDLLWPAVGLLAWEATIVVVWQVVGWVDRRKARARYGPPDPDRPASCPSCGNPRLKEAWDFGRKDPRLKCPACGERALAPGEHWIS
jgi:hypothetical protein